MLRVGFRAQFDRCVGTDRQTDGVPRCLGCRLLSLRFQLHRLLAQLLDAGQGLRAGLRLDPTAAPVLLSIPLIVTSDDTERHKRWMRTATVSVVASLVLLVGVSFFVAHDNETLVQLVSRGRM